MRRKLSVLHVSHISNYTPPIGYGGIELVVDILAKSQKREGHDVRVLGIKPPNVKLEYPMISLFNKPIKRPRLHEKFYTVLQSLINSLGVDVIHMHVQWLAPSLAPLRWFDKAVLLTLHADLKNNLAGRIFKVLKVPLIAISKTQKARLERKGFRIFDVVYHGIEVDRYPFSKDKKNYLVYLGRIDPSKGLHTAIRVSRRADEKLLIIGPIADKLYFDTLIKPFIDGRSVIYLGEVDFETKVRALSHAKALIYPVQYEEFFGLVMIEALACGTPVIGFAKGSVTEIVKDGVTGFIIDSEDKMVRAIREIDKIDPSACRRDIKDRFSAESIVKKYEEVYIRLLEGVESE